MRRRRPSDETLVTLRGKLEDLPARSAERQNLLQGCADLHGVSVATLYRALREQFRPRSLHRRDRGRPRRVPQQDMERFCELVAAMKLRTTNQKGRHLSTVRALDLLVEHGIETPDGLVRAPPGLLTRTTVNRYLRAWGLDDERMSRPPPAQRFQAERVNDCWQFDLSPSDLKQVPAPLWVEPGRGPPTLMLFSAVDDCSGVAYQEYRCVYGEDVAAALRFLFNAMSPKEEPGLVLQGIPAMLYLDNGPVAKSGVFRRVMAQLGVDVRTHMPRGSDGRRVTARAKGKVERPFRTVKEAHETLYHFHAPQNEAEANLWLRHYLARYNAQPHRSGRHSRAEDWSANLPAAGLRAMCGWDRFCAFAREPERRKVGVDARVQVDGVSYEVEPSLAGETVTLWWGLFDHELFVEHADQRFGPFGPIDGPIPLHRYRSFRKSTVDGRLDRIEALAGKLGLPRATLQDMLARENRVIVSKAVSIEKSRITLNTLVTALFCDLSPDKRLAIPKNTELRDRTLAELVRKRRKPIVLIVDEAHDLRQDTLTSLKRLIETAADGEGKLSVLLAGHPKLRRDLRSPTMEEIGYRTTVFSLEGVTGSQREYITWTLKTCAADGVLVDDILDPTAVDLLAARLRTPLQIEQHLTLALETGYQASEKPVGEAIVDSVLSKQIDDLEPTLTRHGYTATVLGELLGTRPGEVRALFRQTLGAERSRELKEQMLAAGLPV